MPRSTDIIGNLVRSGWSPRGRLRLQIGQHHIRTLVMLVYFVMENVVFLVFLLSHSMQYTRVLLFAKPVSACGFSYPTLRDWLACYVRCCMVI